MLLNSDTSKYNLEDSLYNVSIDTKNTDNKIVKNMTESKNIIISGDKLKNKYASKYNFSYMPSSVDAIYIFKNDDIYLIEFKNGSINSDKIYKKVYDTFIILLDINIIENIDFSRNNVSFLLVYNEDNTSQANIENEVKVKTGSYKDDLFGISNFQKYLFKESFACSKEDFDKFIVPKFIEEEK